MKYSLGHNPDPFDHRDHVFGASRNISVADSVDRTNYIDRIRNQGGTSRCVNMALSRASHILAQLEGFSDADYPSDMAPYAVGRAMERTNPFTPLRDEGSQPRLVLKAAQDWGLCSEKIWPADESKINDVPPPDVFMQSADYKLSQYQRLTSDGGQRVLDLKAAMSAGHMPIFAMSVDQSFMDLGKGQVYTGPRGPSLGGHMLAAVGYRPGMIQLCNSWGESWADGGLAWLSEEFFGGLYVSDVYALTVAPVL